MWDEWDECSVTVRRDTAEWLEAGPIERARMLKRRPLFSYSWPDRPPPSSAVSVSTSSAPQASITVSTAEVTIPIISVSPPSPSPSPEPEAATQAPRLTQSDQDQSKLTVPVSKRPKDSRSKTTRKRRDRSSSDLAPKPSIFSFDLCRHPRCPLEYAHEKEVFRRTWQWTRSPDIPEGGFGDFGPCWAPFEITVALGRVQSCKRKQARGRSCTVDQEDVDLVEGFQDAHCREMDRKVD